MKIKPSMRYSLIDYKLYKKYFGELDEDATILYNNQPLKIFYENLLEVPEEKIDETHFLLAYDNASDCVVIPFSRNVYISGCVYNSISEVCSETPFLNNFSNFASDIADFFVTNTQNMGLPLAPQKTTEQGQVEVQAWGFNTTNNKQITPFDCDTLFYDLFTNLFFKHYEEVTILAKKAKIFENLDFSNINDLEKIVFTTDSKTTSVTTADTPEMPNSAIDNYANFKQNGVETKTHEKSLKTVLGEFKNDLFGFLSRVLPEIVVERGPDEVEYAF